MLGSVKKHLPPQLSLARTWLNLPRLGLPSLRQSETADWPEQPPREDRVQKAEDEHAGEIQAGLGRLQGAGGHRRGAGRPQPGERRVRPVVLLLLGPCSPGAVQEQPALPRLAMSEGLPLKVSGSFLVVPWPPPAAAGLVTGRVCLQRTPLFWNQNWVSFWPGLAKCASG